MLLELLAVVISLGFLGWLAQRFLIEKVDPYSLVGKHVLITGGSSGIGLSTAIECIKEGARCVTIFARNPRGLQEAAAQIQQVIEQRQTAARGAQQAVLWFSVDVSNSEAVASAVQQAEQQAERPIDVAILSAGISIPGNLFQVPLDRHRQVMDINYFGSLICAQEVLKSMTQRARLALSSSSSSSSNQIPVGSIGRIVFISSMAGLTGVAGFSAYTPSKFALRGLAETLYMECRPLGILVNLVNPPDVDTPMFKEEMKIKPEATKLISEGSGLFTPQRIAADIVDSIKHWRFLVQTGLDGLLLGAQVSAVTPCSSLSQLLFEVSVLGIGRVVALFYLRSFNRICARFSTTFLPSQTSSS